MDFLVKKTSELTDQDKVEIIAVFNEVFDKNRTVQEFDNQFYNNPIGYSYHSLMVENGKIVGCDSFIPSYYMLLSEKRMFANSVDTMVKKKYRDFFNFYEMVNAATDFMKKDGVDFVYGFPNDNSYPIYIKSGLMHDIGKMNTYCLPYRIGGIKPKLKALNFVSKLGSLAYLGISSIFSKEKVFSFPINKESESYNATRYSRMDIQYENKTYKGVHFMYKIMEFENIRTAFLIDVVEKSAKNFNRAVAYILKTHPLEVDLVLYIGYLPFHIGLVKMPKKFEPKNFNFTGVILNEKLSSDTDILFDIHNWDVNLSNYDLI